MHVLLVDDDERLRADIAELLVEAGLVVTESADAEQALSVTAGGYRPALLVTDVDLGAGMDGFGLVDAVRRRWPAVPVLMISGRGSSFQGCRPSDTDRYLQKPFSCSSLLQEVRELSETGGPH